MRVFLPRTLGELWDVWRQNPGAVPFAGGTDLLVQVRAGKRRPAALIGLERVEELREIRETSSAIVLGAGVTHAELLDHPLVAAYCPVLAEALRVLGSPPIRNMGTLGGNVVTASPAGDTLPPLYVLGAEVFLANEGGMRTLPIDCFIRGPGQTCLDSRELVTAIRVPKDPAWTLTRYEKVGRRKAMAIAVASLAACVRLSPGGIVEVARLAWGSVGPTVVTAPGVEAVLKGKRLTPGVLRGVAPLVREAVSPIDDIRASAAYRAEVSVGLLIRLSETGGPRGEAIDA